MKKLLSVILLIGVLLSCCSCAAKEGESAQAPALDPASPEALYGHIDQTVPVDGVYKIWNAEGVKNMINHPDGKFELLCNIDMAGAALAPIAEFTGTIKGGNFGISNFTLQGDGESFGFVSVNRGTIQNFLLTGVTFVPSENAKNIGAIAGINEGKINRCTVTGALTVKQAAEGAACGGIVGVNTKDLTNVVATVDVTYAAPGSAKVGALAGIARGGTMDFLENHGKLEISGTNKMAGLFAGEAEGLTITNCLFGGADNSVDGKLFTNFTGSDDDETVVVTGGKWRDNAAIEPLPANVQAVRDKVVQTMYDMGTVEWTLKENLVHSCTCNLTICHGTFNTEYTYYGAPYNHKASSYARFKYCQNEDGTMKDWFYDQPAYDGYDCYIGSDCSSAVQTAWFTVSNSVSFGNTRSIPEIYGKGTIAVGDYVCDFRLEDAPEYRTRQYIQATDQQVMLASYAAMRPGDAIVSQQEAGGHTRMIASNPVIIRDQAGSIDPTYSYVLTHEQGAEYLDDVNLVYSSWLIDHKYTFANLMQTEYIPVTCQELLSGEMEPVEVTLEGKNDGFEGMFSGKVKANYHLDSVWLKINDSQGSVVLEHPLWVTLGRFEDGGSNYDKARIYIDEYDISGFAQVLTGVSFQRGEAYRYTVTAGLATQDYIVVNEGSFTYGTN